MHFFLDECGGAGWKKQVLCPRLGIVAADWACMMVGVAMGIASSGHRVYNQTLSAPDLSRSHTRVMVEVL